MWQVLIKAAFSKGKRAVIARWINLEMDVITTPSRWNVNIDGNRAEALSGAPQLIAAGCYLHKEETALRIGSDELTAHTSRGA